MNDSDFPATAGDRSAMCHSCRWYKKRVEDLNREANSIWALCHHTRNEKEFWRQVAFVATAYTVGVTILLVIMFLQGE